MPASHHVWLCQVQLTSARLRFNLLASQTNRPIPPQIHPILTLTLCPRPSSPSSICMCMCIRMRITCGSTSTSTPTPSSRCTSDVRCFCIIIVSTIVVLSRVESRCSSMAVPAVIAWVLVAARRCGQESAHLEFANVVLKKALG